MVAVMDRGVAVGRISVGGAAVGGRKAVGAAWGAQPTTRKKTERRTELGGEDDAQVFSYKKRTRFRVHSILRFFFDRGSILTTAAIAQIDRQGDFTRH